MIQKASSLTAVHHEGCLVRDCLTNLRQYSKRFHGAVQLARAVIRDNDAVCAQGDSALDVGRMQDALYDQVAAPSLPDSLDIAPAQVIAPRRIANRGCRQDRCAARRKRILEMRHSGWRRGPGDDRATCAERAGKEKHPGRKERELQIALRQTERDRQQNA